MIPQKHQSGVGELPPSAELTTAFADTAPPLAADCLSDSLVAEMIEHLAGLIEQVLQGEGNSLLEIEIIWPLVLSELSPEAALDCQADFVQFVLHEWEAAEPGPDRNPHIAAAAVDVLSVLLETEEELI